MDLTKEVLDNVYSALLSNNTEALGKMIDGYPRLKNECINLHYIQLNAYKTKPLLFHAIDNDVGVKLETFKFLVIDKHLDISVLDCTREKNILMGYIERKCTNGQILNFILTETNINLNYLSSYNKLSVLNVAAYCNLDIMSLLLTYNNIDVLSRGYRNDTILHSLLDGNYNIPQQQIMEICVELFKKGVDVNAVNDLKQTPLHYLVSAHRVGIVELTSFLLENGAAPSLDIVSSSGHTPLTRYAYNKTAMDLRILQLLMTKQNINIPYNGSTVFRMVLIEHILSEPEVVGIEAVKLTLGFGANPNIPFFTTNISPLFYVFMHRKVGLFKLLLQHGARLTKTEATEMRLTSDGMRFLEIYNTTHVAVVLSSPRLVPRIGGKSELSNPMHRDIIRKLIANFLVNQ
jgi:ankyrin repeat protein